MGRLNSADVHLWCAESRGEPEMRIFVGALADELSAHVSREDGRSHSGGHHGGVSYFDRAGRVGLATQAREVRVVAVSLCDVQVVFCAGATRRAYRPEEARLPGQQRRVRRGTA